MAEQNSIESYLELMDTDYLGEKQKVIWDFIRLHPDCTYNDISRALGMHHNTVTARIKELREMGMIVKSGDVTDEHTNKKNSTYHVRRIDEEPDNMISDAIPYLPRPIYEFLKQKTDRDATDGKMASIHHRVEYLATRNGGKVSLYYGNFLKIRNIMLVCEDFEQNHYIITGVNYTVLFRIK